MEVLLWECWTEEQETTTNARYKCSPALKAKVVLEAIKGHATVAGLARRYEVHPKQTYSWKKALLRGADSAFVADNRGSAGELAEREKA